MKIRNGFVSNSSSSSFILKGFVIPRESINYEEIMKKFDFDYQPIVDEYVEKYSYNDRQDAIRDVYWDKFDNILTEMTDMLRDIKEKFNIESPVKIIVTTRCC